MTGQWSVPPGMTGDPRLVRIGPGTVGDEEHTCQAYSAVKARPRVQPVVRPRYTKATHTTFALGPVQDTLDRIEFDGVPVDGALAELDRRAQALHPGLRRFVEHAVRAYLVAHDSRGGGLRPVRHYWVARREGDETWELYAWGRRYESPDGRLREFRFLRFGQAGARERDPAQTAIAAYTASYGQAATWPRPWSELFTLHGGGTAASGVDWVRVVEVGLLDGSVSGLFEGSGYLAGDYFERNGRERVPEIALGGPPQAGSSCAGCKRLTACEAPGGPVKTPGLLQIPGGGRAAPRKVSASDLRYHRTCPAQAYMYELKLPRAAEYDERARIGQAVHRWLEITHSGRVRTPCNAHDMPRSSDEWAGGRWPLAGESARIGARMLAQHIETCPFHHSDTITMVRPEPQLTFHDTAANVIVLVKPDLLYRHGGSWVWRETKTTQRDRRYHDDPLDEYPQLAIAVLLLARGVFGGDPEGSRIELETLRPGFGDFELIDPTEPERVSKAREVVAAHALPWYADSDFAARAGAHCDRCPVSRWCPSFPGGPGAAGAEALHG